MNKILAIGIKDLQLIFRDRAALVLMLLTPFLITLGMGFVSGAFEGDSGNAGIGDIPVMVINLDEGTLGDQLEAVFSSDDLASLLDVVDPVAESEAKALVDADELAAVVIIPADFSTTMVPDSDSGEMVIGDKLEIYRSPSRPVSASVIETIVGQFIDQVDSGTALVLITLDQLFSSGETDRAAIDEKVNRLIATQQNNQTGSLITINQHSGSTGDEDAEESGFSVLSTLAPGMALFFLMYTVTLGGRNFLQERKDGTLARMQTTATSGGQILGGKTFGIFLVAVSQVGILIVASTLLYGLKWGNWGGIIALVISAAVAATGWGLLFASAFRTTEQVTGVGTGVMLVFGAISGTFLEIDNRFVNGFGMITPNQWALRGFTKLAIGRPVAEILPNIGALWLIAIVLFAISMFLYQRQVD